MFMPQADIQGKKAWWPKYGRSTAGLKNRGVKGEIANPDSTQISADLKTWEFLGMVHDFDGVRMKAAEQAALVESATMALGRAVDVEGMSLLNSITFNAGQNYLDTSAAQVKATDVALLLGQWMGFNDIPPDGQIFGGISMLTHQALMGDSAYANSQWVGGDLPFKQMGRTMGRSWNFVNWVVLPDSYFPSAVANTIDCFIWHRPSVGWVNNKKLTTEWMRDIDYGAWKVRHESEGCGIVLRNEGIAKLRVKTNLATITKS
jgi:hypothetical protein